MTEPAAIDYGTALQTALYNRLVARADGGAKRVFQHVPENQAPPVWIIGDMQSEPRGGKGEVSDRWTFIVFVVTKGPSRAVNMAEQAKVRGALVEWTPGPTDEVIFGKIGQMELDTNPSLKDDIYYGTITGTCTTEPA